MQSLFRETRLCRSNRREPNGGKGGRERAIPILSLLKTCDMSVRPALTPFMIFAGKTIQDVDGGRSVDA